MLLFLVKLTRMINWSLRFPITNSSDEVLQVHFTHCVVLSHYSFTQLSPVSSLTATNRCCSNEWRSQTYISSDLYPDGRIEALLHEVMHGIADTMKLDLKETYIGLLSEGLLCVLRDNPELCSTILDLNKVKEEV